MITSRAAITLVARRELRARLLSKPFLVGLIVIVVFILAGFGLASWFGREQPTTIGLIGDQPAAALVILESQAALEERKIEFVDYSSVAAAEAAIEDGDLDVAVVDGSTIVMKRLNPGLMGFVSGAWQQAGLLEGLDDAGLTSGDVSNALDEAAPLTLRELEPDDERDAKDGIAAVSVILLFMSIQLAGAYIMMGVLEEKTNKVVELILSSIRARDLLVGKILGIGALGLVQIVVLAGTALLASAFVSSTVLPSISASMLVWGLVWFLCGYLLYGSLFAAGASLVSRQEDAQSALGPVSVLIMLSYLGSIFAASDPESTFARVLSLLPPTAPFAMPGRIATGSANALDLTVALLLTLGSVALVVMAAERIYVRSVLHTDRALSWREAWKLEI